MRNRVINIFLQNLKSRIIIGLVIFLFFAGYYFILLYSRIATDIQAHAAIAYSFAVDHTKLTPNFLYFILVALISGFTKYYPVYYGASIVIICAAITAKFLLTIFYLNQYSELKNNIFIAFGLSFAMLFIFALPGSGYFNKGNFYFGQLTATVWHNSTVIFLMPFAILLFFKSYELLFSNNKEQHRKILFQVTILVILNALIKPSFLFTLLPSVFICFFYNKSFSKKGGNKFHYLLPYLIGMILIALEYYIIYKLNYISSSTNNHGEESKVILSPFEVWKSFSDNMWVAAITSLFFPVIFIILTKGGVLKNKMVQFSLINFLLGLCIWILLAEEGARKYHANFYWQIVVTVYLLFLSLLIDFVKRVQLKQLCYYKQWLIGGAFLLHFIWGVFYWLKIIIFRGYN